ncbi:MAG TPA: DUF47 family protein [Desulfitobacteriaceae bacterium]|nr:DUF47 family protein [Desulfitobacteriaceae bacterium]
MFKSRFWERLFPVKRDFYKMLSDQAKATSEGIEILSNWLKSRSLEDHQLLFRQGSEADNIRFNMEGELIEAFATPFDRQDIYSLSVEMDRILYHAESTLLEMEDFEVSTDSHIIDMVLKLKSGITELANAVTLLETEPIKAKIHVEIIRQVELAIDHIYRAAMKELFRNPDPNYIMKYREVYHHIKDAGVHLGYTTDVLHKIVVRVV